MTSEIQCWDFCWNLEDTVSLSGEPAGASGAIPARPGMGIGLGVDSHLLLPPLQGGKVKDPEITGDSPGCESPKQIHGTTSSRNIGSCMEGAG